MNSDKLIKLVAGVGLFGAWLALVILKMVPAAEFVNALQLALMALGIYHASTQQLGSNVVPYVTGTALVPVDAARQAVVSSANEPAATQPVTPVPVAVAVAQPGTPTATLQ